MQKDDLINLKENLQCPFLVPVILVWNQFTLLRIKANINNDFYILDI